MNSWPQTCAQCGVLWGSWWVFYRHITFILYTLDLGTCIFWDLLRLISPSHVIHLHGDKGPGHRVYWFREELVPVEAFKNFHHSPGWLLTPPNSCSEPHPPDSDNQSHPSVAETSKQRGGHVRRTQTESPETTQHSTDSDSEPVAVPEASRWVSAAQEDSKRILASTSRKLKLKRLLNKKKKTVRVGQPSLSKGKALGRKSLHRLKANLLKDPRRQARKQIYKVLHDTSWKSCGVFQFFSYLVNPYKTQIK